MKRDGLFEGMSRWNQWIRDWTDAEFDGFDMYDYEGDFPTEHADAENPLNRESAVNLMKSLFFLVLGTVLSLGLIVTAFLLAFQM